MPSACWGTDFQVALAGVFGVIGFGAVWIEQGGEPVGGLAQVLGFEPGGDARQVGFGQGAALIVDVGG
jgi:hypothetical protein